jgi:hypothetical protein
MVTQRSRNPCARPSRSSNGLCPFLVQHTMLRIHTAGTHRPHSVVHDLVVRRHALPACPCLACPVCTVLALVYVPLAHIPCILDVPHSHVHRYASPTGPCSACYQCTQQHAPAGSQAFHPGPSPDRNACTQPHAHAHAGYSPPYRCISTEWPGTYPSVQYTPVVEAPAQFRHDVPPRPAIIALPALRGCFEHLLCSADRKAHHMCCR